MLILFIVFVLPQFLLIRLLFGGRDRTDHPDRYATQGADAQAHAQTKFLKIQQAYEEIKRMRNIV